MGSPYSSQSSAGYNSSPPPDDGTTVAANKITWAKIKSAITDPIKTLADAINSALRTALNVTPSTTSTTYTTVVGDHLTTIEVTGSTTISLGDAATMIAQTMGYRVTVYNKGTGTVTLGVITATDTLNGHANGSISLASGQAATVTVAQSGVGYEVTGAAGFGIVYLTGAAGTNTITAAAPATLIGLYAGLKVCLYPAASNTAAATLNITPSGGSALTAKSIFWAGAACSGGELVINVPVLLEYDGTQFNVLGPVIGTRITNSLAGNVAINNAGLYFDGPTVAQGTVGTWFVTGQVVVSDTVGGVNVSIKLWDGTNVVDSAHQSVIAANNDFVIHLSGYITSPAGNLRISVKTASATGVIIFNGSGNSKDSTISAIRIG